MEFAVNRETAVRRCAAESLEPGSTKPTLIPLMIRSTNFAFAVLLYMTVAPHAQAQQALPNLSDRTAEHLVGLGSDSRTKAVELGDFDGDGIEDLMISRRDANPVLLINENARLVNRTGSFLPAARSARNSNYAEAFDADGDGDLDIAFGRLSQTALLFRNLGQDTDGNWLGFDGGTVLRNTNNVLVIESGDVTGDGAPDLFVIQVENAGNVLLVNDGNGNFSQQTSRLGGLANLARGHATLLDDVDSDGDIDIIYIESDLFLYIYYNDGNGNYRNSRRSTFRNPDDFAYIFGAADWNGDGIFDYRQYSNPAPRAEMSTGRFNANGIPQYTIRQEAPMLRGNRKHGFVHMRDFDDDGDIDYVLSSQLRNFGGLTNSNEGMRTEMVLSNGDSTFVTFVAPDWANEESTDMKMIDINRDGNLDMFIAHERRYGIYINNAAPREVTLEEISSTPASVGSETTLSVNTVTGTDVRYDWDFGDGTSTSTTVPNISHVYAEPGRYPVSVTVTADGRTAQQIVIQRVHEPLLPSRSISSMSIAYQARDDGARVYVVNPDNDSVTAMSAAGDVLAEITVGRDPRSLGLDGDGSLFVVNKGDATLVRLDTNSLDVAETVSLPPGSRPHGIVIDKVNRLAYIALESSGRVIKVDLASSAIVDDIETGPNPRELALSADGTTLYAPRFITLPVGGESTRNPVKGGGEVLVINTATMRLTSSIGLPYHEPLDNLDTSVENRGIPNYLRAPALSPSGLDAVLPVKVDNIYRGSMRDGNAREHDMLVRGMLSRLDLGNLVEDIDARLHFDNNSQPTAVAFGPTGNYLFVVHEASRAFEVIDFYDNSIVFSSEVEFAPQGIVVSDDGGRVFVHNYLSRSVSIIDASGLINGTSGNADIVDTVSTVSDEALSELVLRGKRLFHDSSDLRLSAQKYISCATCHDDAGHDGRAWDFSDAGEGLRNTIDLRGRAGIGDGNVHWSANFDEFHDFENDIREIFDGTGLLDDVDFADTAAPLGSNSKSGLSTDLDALAAFASTLGQHGISPEREIDGSLSAAAIEGREVFRAAGCASCHSGTNFSDSPSAVGHDIGTVDADTGGRLGQPLLDGGLDTPTLRGLWHGAPYLHDGAAATVQEAVLAHTDNMNFDVSSLDTNSLDNLVAYLLQIDDAEPVATSLTDLDGDGIPNDLDPDDDNNGVDDDDEATDPTTPTLAPSNPSATLRVDGDLDDWSTLTRLAADPDDVSGSNNTLDYAEATLAHDDANLYVLYRLHAPDAVQITWGLSVQIDADANPNTGFRGFGGELPIGVDYMIEGNTLHRYNGTGNDFTWTGPIALFSADDGGRALEFAIPRTAIGDPSTIRLFFYADNASVGGTATDFFPDSANDINASTTERSFAYRFGTDPVSPPTDGPDPSSRVVYNPASAIAVDGDLSDWSSHTSFGVDPDDATGTGNVIDWREGWMAHGADTLYIAWRNDEAAQLSWGNGIMFDTDRNFNTGFQGFGNELPIGIDYLLEANEIHRYTGTGSDWSWVSSGFITPVISGTDVELEIALTMLGNPSAMDLFFSGNNAATGGTVVDNYPNAVNSTVTQLQKRHFTYSTVEPIDLPPVIADLNIVVDGDIADWDESAQLGGEDPDEVSGSNTLDWRRAWMGNDDDLVYLGYQGHEALTLTWGLGGYLDTDQSLTTGFRGFANELPLGAEFLIEGDQLFRYTGASQTEWSWQSVSLDSYAMAGDSAELSILRSTLGDPEAIDLVLRADNSSIGGDRVDTLPDTGRFTYRMTTPQSSAPPALQAASPVVNTGGGGGGAALVWLLLLPLIGSRLCGRLHMRTIRWMGEPIGKWPVRTATAALAGILVLSACGGGGGTSSASNAGTNGNAPSTGSAGLNGGSDTGSTTSGSAGSDESTVPNNNPSMTAGSTTPAPNSNPSFATTLDLRLDGTQSSPAVATRAVGMLSLQLNTRTGVLSGNLEHSVSGDIGASIRLGDVGENGRLVIELEMVAENEYRVPLGTVLSAEQIAAHESGQYYAVVQSAEHPDGEIRAQMTDTEVRVAVLGTLDDIQAKVFTPICSICHTGGGQSLPGIMNLSTADASYNSLVNVTSLQESDKERVVPNDSTDSYLIHKLTGTQEVGSRMPFRGTPLDTAVIDAIRQWIDTGTLR